VLVQSLFATTSTGVATWISLLLLGLSVTVYLYQARVLINQRKEFEKQTAEFGKQTEALSAQTKHAIDTNRALLSQNVNGTMHQLSMIFLSYPQLRAVFYDGEPPPINEPDRTRAKVIAEMFVDFMSMTLTNEILAPTDEREGWINFFDFIGRHSPAVMDYWRERCDWYEEPVHKILDPILKERSHEGRPS